ncbi:glutamine synthetase [Romboutsia weinsteinii]|uniref:glutamine synthetase n=1 Tax=Romboutsia weinsteinii TaxID=2020949 RepID=A0A371J346_9FIRM|nr:glutamine synthetase [Romboutsia weinsteinii]RDY27210.1 glutamine synthetase [Romboutsia weinsteinii]
MERLLYIIRPYEEGTEDIKLKLIEHNNVKFVSLMGIDLGGNATDEKIPMRLMLEDIDGFLKSGIQTDGSSVELDDIATLHNARVDLIPDRNTNWYVDYNYEYLDINGRPIGTLKIPAFLIHENKAVCSRGVLKRAVENFESKLLSAMKDYPQIINSIGINSVDDIEKIHLTSATELEFWVKTPEEKFDAENLFISQSLKEQYWKRTHGTIRTALERSLIELEERGLEPEMGHKEVGGINSSISKDGRTIHVMEQLEIDWKYSSCLQSGDNEIIARELIEDIFRLYGLKVSFKAKPLDGVAGNGEHTHIGAQVKLKDGSIKNLFSPKDMSTNYMSEIGYGAMMGILKNYEVINPIVASSNDSLNRLVPGYEAPVSIVTSLGHSYEIPSRNRSILVGLIRDLNNPLATRFELRSPNPLSNTYLVLASSYQCALDGIINVAKNKLTTKELEKEISKAVGVEGIYLEKSRAYRDENNIFEYYTEEERVERFSKSPRTVYENLSAYKTYPEKSNVLKNGGVFTDDILKSFISGTLNRWIKELKNRIIQENLEKIKDYEILHKTDDMDALDKVVWNTINNLKYYLVKDSISKKSLFGKLREAIDSDNYESASILQIELKTKMNEIEHLYKQYYKNIL